MRANFILILIGLLVIMSCKKKIENIDDYTQFFDSKNFEGAYQTTVSILGTFHFSNSTAHNYIDKHNVNGLSEHKQKELDLIIKKLAAYKPTKILIERDRVISDSLIAIEYQNYLLSVANFDKNDEVYLIAFPLAKKLGIKKIHCSDATADWFGADLDWDNFDEDAYLKKQNQYEKSNRYNYEKAYQLEDSLKSVLNLGDYYTLINSPELQLYNHQIYLTETVLTGAGDNYIGADAVARWYRRNLRIYSNVLDIADFEERDRILIIYGASHSWTLRQFFKDSPDFHYIEINEFLKN